MDYIQHNATLPPPFNLIPNPRWIINTATCDQCKNCQERKLKTNPTVRDFSTFIIQTDYINSPCCMILPNISNVSDWQGYNDLNGIRSRSPSSGEGKDPYEVSVLFSIYVVIPGLRSDPMESQHIQCLR